MVTIRRGSLRAACAAASFSLLTGCGILSPGTTSTPTLMTVSSEVFGQSTDSAGIIQYTLPGTFTCHAGRMPVSPPIGWSGAPANTKSYALVVDDASAPITPYIYWIVFNISPGSTDLEQGQLPPGARQALNSAGHLGYDPPCPQGSPHTYRFTVYALNSMLNLPQGANLSAAWNAIAAAVLDHGRVEASANP
jgi:Raf kinase inhibitor-like YbhB/YbcL family protein